MNFCTTSVERMGELYLGARYGSAGVDGSTGGRSVGVYAESDWGRSSPSMHLRLAILLPTAASVLSPFLSAGPGELQQAHHHCLSLYLSHEWQPHSLWILTEHVLGWWRTTLSQPNTPLKRLCTEGTREMNRDVLAHLNAADWRDTYSSERKAPRIETARTV